MSETNKYPVTFILVTSLFFLWDFLRNLDPILIPHLKKSFSLSTLRRFQKICSTTQFCSIVPENRQCRGIFIIRSFESHHRADHKNGWRVVHLDRALVNG